MASRLSASLALDRYRRLDENEDFFLLEHFIKTHKARLKIQGEPDLFPKEEDELRAELMYRLYGVSSEEDYRKQLQHLRDRVCYQVAECGCLTIS